MAIGGVHRPLDADAIAHHLPGALSELRRVSRALTTTNSFLDRLEACGVVSGEAARRLGLVGPVARASGQDHDCRRDHSFALGPERPVEVPVRQAGDALSRLQVMIEEIEESSRLIGELIDLGLGAERAPEKSSRASASALGWSESARGESLVWLALDSDGRIARARLRPASVRNWRAFDDAARSRNVFTDIPIIEASFWLTVAGIAR